MTSKDEFIELLTEFALNPIEARVYFQLLKYGPQPAAVIAKRLKTHREGVHRTLTKLGKKGVTLKSLSKPTVHAAVPLRDVLDAVLTQETAELRRKEDLKRELVRLSPRLSPFQSKQFCRYRVVTGCKECITASLEQAEAAQHDILTIGDSTALEYSYKHGYFNTFLDAVRRGVEMRFILDIAPRAVEAVRSAIEGGIDVRHYEQYRGIMFTSVHQVNSFTVMIFEPRHGSIDAEHMAFLCESPDYALRLANQFEFVWERSVDGAQLIRELANKPSSLLPEERFRAPLP